MTKSLAEQIADPATGASLYSEDKVYAAIMRMAVGEGYPTELGLDGAEEPMSLARASVEQAAIVTRVINRFADEHGYWLTEYDEHRRPYRSLGGRSREEMEHAGT